jgi:hypothetical protein
MLTGVHNINIKYLKKKVGKQQLSWEVHLANISSALNRKW